MSFNKWAARLRGDKVSTFPQPDAEDEGYYRIPVTEAKLNAAGKTNGQKRIIGWRAVAYFLENGRLVGIVDDRDMTDEEVIDLWTWCCRYPITEQLYRSIERGEPWPDFAPSVNTPLSRLSDHLGDITQALGPSWTRSADIPPLDPIERIVGRDHNAPPEVLPDVAHTTAIDNAISAALKAVTNETQAAQALGSKNRIAELRLAADKAGKALYQPIYAEYKRIHGLWTPMIARAEAAEKKLNTAILTFRESERKRLAKLAEEAAAKQRAIDEETERAAQRAIAKGEPEAAPVIQEVVPIAAPAPLVATYGTRKLKEEERWHMDEVSDFDAVYQHFKHTEQIRAVLTTLATAAVRNGNTVPGTKTHWGLV